MGAVEDEEKRKSERPNFSGEEAIGYVRDVFGIEVKEEDVKKLDSYDDQNFVVSGIIIGEENLQDKRKYLLKFHNGVDSAQTKVIEAQIALCSYLSEKGFNVSVSQRTLSGEDYDTVIPGSGNVNDKESNEIKKLKTGPRHVMRLMSWVEGEILHNVNITAELLLDTGRYLGKLRNALDGFTHKGTEREHLWDMQNIHLIKPYVDLIDDATVRDHVRSVIAEFEESVLPIVSTLPKGVLMGDCNDSNIILSSDNQTVGGIIDFGDIVYSCKIFDLAVCMAYSTILPLPNIPIVETPSLILEGYSQTAEISEAEQKILRICTAARLAISISLGAFSISKDPNNEYLKRHDIYVINGLKIRLLELIIAFNVAQPGRTALVAFWTSDKALVEARFKKAIDCGMKQKIS